MKKKFILASAFLAIVAASALFMHQTPASASSAAAGSRALPDSVGLVYTAATVNSFGAGGGTCFVNMTFVRLPGSTDWLPGILRADCSDGNFVHAVNVNEDPFVVKFTSHNTAFINANVTYKGSPATLSAIVQAGSINSITLVVIQNGQAVLIATGQVSPSNGLVLVNP